MTQRIYGIEFDYENGVSTSLTAKIDETQGLRMIPSQLRMMQEHRIPKLLPVTTEEIDGSLMLRYDISATRREVQLLHMQPPDWHVLLRTIHLLVRTLCEYSDYMLNENHFALHEDLLFAGGDVSDFRLCYLPIAGMQKKPVTEELRCLVLRMLSVLEGPIPAKFAPIFGLLSDELYSLRNLKHQLNVIWLAEEEQKLSIVPPAQEIRAARNLYHPGEWRIKQWFKPIWKRAEKSQAVNNSPGVFTPSGKTEYLSARVHAETDPLLVIRRSGKEEQIQLTDHRWIVGRNQIGVSYTDTSEGVSRIHCEIVKGESGIEAKDLGSMNGTYLNGERMVPYKSYPFTCGDVLKYVQTEIHMASEPQSSQPDLPGSTRNR